MEKHPLPAPTPGQSRRAEMGPRGRGLASLLMTCSCPYPGPFPPPLPRPPGPPGPCPASCLLGPEQPTCQQSQLPVVGRAYCPRGRFPREWPRSPRASHLKSPETSPMGCDRRPPLQVSDTAPKEIIPNTVTASRHRGRQCGVRRGHCWGQQARHRVTVCHPLPLLLATLLPPGHHSVPT